MPRAVGSWELTSIRARLWPGDMGGAVGMDVPREPYYRNEIDLRISRSYGPGRYDRNYEDKGIDYPYPYVRFTEQRNMDCFLELIAMGKINLDQIITHR